MATVSCHTPNRVCTADELQQLADENSSKGFFTAIKQVYGPQKTAVGPIIDAEGSLMLKETSYSV